MNPIALILFLDLQHVNIFNRKSLQQISLWNIKITFDLRLLQRFADYKDLVEKITWRCLL